MAPVRSRRRQKHHLHRCGSLPSPCVHPSSGRLPVCTTSCGPSTWANREREWTALRLPGHASHMMPRCRPPPELVAEASASFPRVIGVGLPHTGTTTLHTLLLLQGCCESAALDPSTSVAHCASPPLCSLSQRSADRVSPPQALQHTITRAALARDRLRPLSADVVAAQLGTTHPATTRSSPRRDTGSASLTILGPCDGSSWYPMLQQAHDLFSRRSQAHCTTVYRVLWRPWA